MEEHRSKKLLDQVRDRSVSDTIPIARCKPTSAGSSATCTSTMCVTRLTGVLSRSRPYSPSWVLNWQEGRVHA